MENKNRYEIKTEKEPEIMLEIEENNRICRHVYQPLFCRSQMEKHQTVLKKISLKNLYKMFKGRESHRLVSIQFLSSLKLIFGGDVQLSKDTITELYKKLSLETLSSEQQVEFDKISELTAQINFKMKHSILINIDDQDKAVKTNNENVKDTYLMRMILSMKL